MRFAGKVRERIYSPCWSVYLELDELVCQRNMCFMAFQSRYVNKLGQWSMHQVSELSDISACLDSRLVINMKVLVCVRMKNPQPRLDNFPAWKALILA